MQFVLLEPGNNPVFLRMKHLIANLFQCFLNYFNPPKKGLKYVIRMFRFFGLHDARFIRIIRGGVRMELSIEDHIERYLLWYGEYEWREHVAMKQILSESGVFVDIGANLGLHSLLLAKNSPAIAIYGFEPSPFMAERFKRNISLNPTARLDVIQKAVGRTNERLPFYLSVNDNLGMSGLRLPENYSGKSLEVECVRLDDWAKDKKIDPIKLIKVDVEGAELDALVGMREILELHRPIMAVEIIASNLSRFGHSPDHVYDFLFNHSYIACRPIDDGIWELVGFGKEGDLIFFIPSESIPEHINFVNA